MKRLNTLRVRFALWTAGLLFLAFALFGAYVYGSMARALFAALDNSLTLNASQIAAALNIDNGQLILPDSLVESPENAAVRGRGFTVRVLTPQGKALHQFGPYPNLPLTPTESFVTYTEPLSETSLRIYTQPVYDNQQLVAIVQVAQSRADVQESLQTLLFTLLVSSPILALLAGGGGYFLAARALAPIDKMTATARKISAEDLSARLEVANREDEVGRLAQTFNEMLARLEDSFRRERQFTSDASHELRTPLTAMQAILGMMRAKRRTPAEYEQAMDDLSEETDRLRTLVENLLRLARGEKQAYHFETVNLSLLLQDVAESLRPLAEAKGLALRCDLPVNLQVWGDSDELIRLFVNLLDNAIQYTERGEVTLRAAQGEQAVVVTVADTGPGIAPEHLPHIFDRFYRVDTSRSRSQRGTGLGLAIAKEIVRAHRGEIEAQSKIGEGTVFTVRLPAG
ncbi:MAG: ATP-binding protein [Anaerolineae bacterium]